MPGGGIRPIAMGTSWRHLVLKVSVGLISHSLDGYLEDLQFGVGVTGGGEAILHIVNRLIEGRGNDMGLSMLLVDFKNAFNLVDREVMLKEVRLHCFAISRWVEICYSSPARLYYGEHNLCSCHGVQQGDPLGPLLFSLVLHPLICEIRDSFILSLHAWYLDDGTIIGDTLVVRKSLELIIEDGAHFGLHLNVDKTKQRACDEESGQNYYVMDTIAKINDPQCELLLLHACAGISKLYFAMRTCSPQVFEMSEHYFDAALCSALERIVTASGPGFGDWQWRLATLPFAFGEGGAYGPTFNDALCAFNKKMETDLLSNAIEIAALKLMKKLMALWQSQMKDHTSDWLKVVPISGLGQTMNDKTYRCVLCYRLGVPLFSVLKPCPACSKVFTRDIYGDHAVSCAGIIGIKHRHNVVRDNLVDICFWSGILAGKEVDIGLGGGCDKPLRPADMLLYSWDEGLDVFVDLTGSLPLTQTGMVDLVPSCAVIDASYHKRVKYEAKYAYIEYGFLPFSFSSLRELEEDAVTLLKRIRSSL
ncbi:putative reverse transcriptase domain-containing protein [Tanacetum coccineum]